MALACPLPATLFSAAIASRALSGPGASSVAELLREVLQTKALRSLGFSLSQQLQRLQRRSASRMHMRSQRGASGRDHAGGFGGVVGVASVAERECIYKSIAYAATALATPRRGAGEPVAARSLILPAVAPRGIKYPRLFKGLGGAGLGSAETGRNGVLGARAPRSWRSARRADQAGGQTQSGRFRPRSPVPASPFQWKRERSQVLSAILRLTIQANRGVASPQNPPPRPGRPPTPRTATTPFPSARSAAPVAALRTFPAGSGEKAERWESGARGSGAPGSRAAKTADRRSSGSGEHRHG